MAPVGTAWEPVIIAPQALCVPCMEHAIVTRGNDPSEQVPDWAAAVVAGTAVLGTVVAHYARDPLAGGVIENTPRPTLNR